MWGIVVAIITAIVVILAVIYVPVPHSFSATIPLIAGHAGEENLTFPSGSQVSGSWSTSNGAAVAWFTITTKLGGTIYQGSGVSGSFSFTAAYSTYDFEGGAGPTATTVQVSGTYSMPLA